VVVVVVVVVGAAGLLAFRCVSAWVYGGNNDVGS